MRVWGSKNHSLSYLDKSWGFHSATDLGEGLGMERRCGCLLNTYYVLGAPYALHHLVIPEVERIVLTLLPTQQMEVQRLREVQWLAQFYITGKRLCWDLNPRAWAEHFFFFVVPRCSCLGFPVLWMSTRLFSRTQVGILWNKQHYQSQSISWQLAQPSSLWPPSVRAVAQPMSRSVA